MLDTVADTLEAKGFVKEASEIDVVSNTLERYAGTHLPYLTLKQAEIRQTVPRRHEALVKLGLSNDAIKDLAEIETFIQSLRDHPAPLHVYGPDEGWVREHLRRSMEIDKRLLSVLEGLEKAAQGRIP